MTTYFETKYQYINFRSAWAKATQEKNVSKVTNNPMNLKLPSKNKYRIIELSSFRRMK